MAKTTEKSAQSSAKKSATGRKAAAASTSKGKRSQPVVRVRKQKVAQGGQPQETDLIRRVALKRTQANSAIGDFGPGDTVGVYVKVREGDKERVQLYRGVCIKVQGKGASRSFTVRKISAGVGVERTFPFRSPSLDRVEVIAHGKVRRSKLYFLRDLKGKAARLINTMVGASDDSQTASAETAGAGATEA